MPDYSERRRFDIINKSISYDKKTEKITFVSVPDPRRYKWIETKDGQVKLFDKFDNVAFSEALVKEMFEKIGKLPFYYEPPGIEDIDNYIEGRKSVLTEVLRGKNLKKYNTERNRDDFINNLKKDIWGFVILSLDIVKSTSLLTELGNKKYSELVSIVLSELTEFIEKFNGGYILKYTGDGMIIYFPEPGFISKNDLAIYCAVGLRKIIYDCINPIFKDNSLPKIDVRIGLDSGEGYIQAIRKTKYKDKKELFGRVISFAIKIQDTANPGEIYLGEITEKNIHSSWREKCKKVELNNNFDLRSADGKIYQIYNLVI